MENRTNFINQEMKYCQEVLFAASNSINILPIMREHHSECKCLAEDSLLPVEDIVIMEPTEKVQTSLGDNCKYLLVAAKLNRRATVINLLEIGIDVNCTDINGNTPLHYAASYGCEEIAKDLLEAGALLSNKNHNQDLPIHLAAKNGYTEVVRLFLQKSVYMNPQNMFLNTPMHVAIHNGQTNVVNLLLESGANIQICNNMGETAVDCALTSHFKGVIDAFLANVAIQNEMLFKAVSLGLPQIVDKLLQSISVNSTNSILETPLHVAASNGHEEIANILISHNASLHLLDKSKRTILYKAADKGNVGMVSLFLKEGSEIDTASIEIAALKGHFDVLKMLLTYRKNESKSSDVLHKSVEGGCNDIVSYLLDLGYNFDGCDSLGRTPLYVASLHGHERIVEILLQKGANPDKTGTESSPIRIAIKKQHVNIVKLLLDYNANTEDEIGKKTLLHEANATKNAPIIALLNGKRHATEDIQSSSSSDSSDSCCALNDQGVSDTETIRVESP